MSDYQKPLPEPDPVTRPYWDSLKAHAMELSAVAGAASLSSTRGICPHCSSGELVGEVAGRGTIHAFTIVHRHRHPASPPKRPTSSR